MVGLNLPQLVRSNIGCPLYGSHINLDTPLSSFYILPFLKLLLIA